MRNYRFSKNQQKSQATSYGWNCNKICNYQSHPYLNVEKLTLSIKYFYAVLFLTHSFYFLSNTWKYNFLIDHHYETKLESSDSVALNTITEITTNKNAFQ